MDSLPFARRQARTRSIPEPAPRETFGQIRFHCPINKQTVPDRTYKQGTIHQTEMKAPIKAVDGRLDQLERNRMNMFSTFGTPTVELTRTQSPPLTRSTRHGMTPYSYSTYWLTHPPKDTSLSPNKCDYYQTSFLSTDVADRDKQARTSLQERRLETKRFSANRIGQEVQQWEEAARRKDETNIRDIRAQREAYHQALLERQKTEKVRYFD